MDKVRQLKNQWTVLCKHVTVEKEQFWADGQTERQEVL